VPGKVAFEVGLVLGELREAAALPTQPWGHLPATAGASGNGARFGSQSSWDEFTHWRWVTVRDQAHGFPF
jgi:hypothetical protein